MPGTPISDCHDGNDVIECNDLEIGDFKFDVWITAGNDLGITVYLPGDDEHSRDIIVSKDLKSIWG